MSLTRQELRAICRELFEDNPEILEVLNEFILKELTAIATYAEVVCNSSTISEEDAIEIITLLKQK
jgi:hypothetical protein